MALNTVKHIALLKIVLSNRATFGMYFCLRGDSPGDHGNFSSCASSNDLTLLTLVNELSWQGVESEEQTSV